MKKNKIFDKVLITELFCAIDYIDSMNFGLAKRVLKDILKRADLPPKEEVK